MSKTGPFWHLRASFGINVLHGGGMDRLLGVLSLIVRVWAQQGGGICRKIIFPGEDAGLNR